MADFESFSKNGPPYFEKFFRSSGRVWERTATLILRGFWSHEVRSLAGGKVDRTLAKLIRDSPAELVLTIPSQLRAVLRRQRNRRCPPQRVVGFRTYERTQTQAEIATRRCWATQPFAPHIRRSSCPRARGPSMWTDRRNVPILFPRSSGDQQFWLGQPLHSEAKASVLFL